MNQPAAPAFPIGLSFDEARAVVARVAREQRLPVESLAPGRAHGRIQTEEETDQGAEPERHHHRGVGGQPGAYTSTGTIWSTPWTIA